ncbi:MAG: hypothetical protein LAP21_26715 [Acidobacteriia bacterium]|nr:hypothetical protein [Terriglobia bacterium]
MALKGVLVVNGTAYQAPAPVTKVSKPTLHRGATKTFETQRNGGRRRLLGCLVVCVTSGRLQQR